MGALPTGRLGDICTHGARILTASSTRTADGLPIARLGDLVSCPLKGHGVNPIISVQTQVTTDNKPTGRISATSKCGATIITGSPSVFTG